MKFIKLFEPIKIGRIELRNRIIMPAMDLHFTTDGFVNDRILKYYELRAEGGAGMIIVGFCNVEKHLSGRMGTLDLSEDKYIPGLERLCESVHKHGVKIMAQISPRYLVEAHQVTKDDIRSMVEAMGEAGGRAKKAGFDGVEIIASGGAITYNFISKANKRDDEYGGSLEGRLRFAREEMEAIREKVKDELVLSLRLIAHEFMGEGYDWKEAKEIARLLVSYGLNMINITAGGHRSKIPQITMEVPRGGYAFLAREIKEVVPVPVASSNRFNDPAVAEDVLRRGWADLICIARGFHADPQFARKAQEGEVNEIRKCIGCCEGCFDPIWEFKSASCLVNPWAGREYNLEWQIKPADKRKNIVVIGGGPAGMEAARVSAMRGHNVVLFERRKYLGGNFRLASRPPGRLEIEEFLEWEERQLLKLEVKVRLNEEATLEKILEEKPDAVIIAQGGIPKKLGIPGEEKAVSVQDIMESNIIPGRKVVVIGGGGVGCETALYIATMDTIKPDVESFLGEFWTLELQKKRDVTIVEILPKVASGVGRATRWVLLKNLREANVKILTKTKPVEIKDDRVVVETNGERKFIEADTVVIAIGANSGDSFSEELRRCGLEVHVVGDANIPARRALFAVEEGARAGLKV